MTKLTNDEKRRIIVLYEDNKSIAEIKQATNRSREAIIKTLTEVGLYENGVLSLACDRARYKTKNWYNMSVVDRDTIISKYLPEIKQECKTRYNILFSLSNESTTNLSGYIKISDIISYCNNMVSNLEECRKNNMKIMKNVKNSIVITECVSADEYFQSQLCLYKYTIPSMIEAIKNGDI